MKEQELSGPEGQRLIEVSFPLKQASIDSLHEKSVRQGHISTLHIWPARRPLAASRAALITTLLPDPGDPEECRRLIQRIGGSIVSRTKPARRSGGQTEDRVVEETVGGILHWGRESGPDLEWIRDRIKQAFRNRIPRVLDPFAGGGAIPFEAMRLGCEVTAVDLSPVAWIILRATLEYPRRLAGEIRPLPSFALESDQFLAQYFKGTRKLSRKELEQAVAAAQLNLLPPPEANLAWHFRAWGMWMVDRAKRQLEGLYSVDAGDPAVAFLWARTVRCKNCRATIPLLKTKWLARTDTKRVVLTLMPLADRSGVKIGMQHDVPVRGSNAAQRREHDRRIGAGTMTKSGAKCPCCPAIMTMEDLRVEGTAGRMGSVMTAVVVQGHRSKDYRLASAADIARAAMAAERLDEVFSKVPFGLPTEPTPRGGPGASRAFSVDGFGLDQWSKLYLPRQLVALGTFVTAAREARDEMRTEGYPPEWVEALSIYMSLAIDRLADRSSALCRPDPTPTQSGVINTFSRFALPMTWDFAEGVTIESASGGFAGSLEWVAKVLDHALRSLLAPPPTVLQMSATQLTISDYDLVITDPPYYDAIPYSDLMDFFYVWLRRSLVGVTSAIDSAFQVPLGPKWDSEHGDGELIDDPSRFGGDKARSKATYEEGMFRSFKTCYHSLKPEGRLVVVFAHKHPDAWDALVSAIIRAGFVVDGSWPIQTEMGNRTRALSSAALASSVWLVCKKRPVAARSGWDNVVLDEMGQNIAESLHHFWDAGIRGPDFVWAATGPALEAYSRYPVVKKANAPGEVMQVSEFLAHVRRMVVAFVIGRVLAVNGARNGASNLDPVTAYYLLHRHDFQFVEAPIGACILYAVSCGISDRLLVDQYDVLTHGKRAGRADVEDVEDDEGEEDELIRAENSSSTVRLKRWEERKRKSMGLESEGTIPPLIDQIHRLMQLWRDGNVVKVDEYIENRGLRRNQLFRHVLQSLIELSSRGDAERTILESISNHIGARAEAGEQQPTLFAIETTR